MAVDGADALPREHCATDGLRGWRQAEWIGGNARRARIAAENSF